jgi:hypothetical protein
MWLPRPIMQRSPMLTTGSVTIVWPGTMPALMPVCGPMSVSLPIRIQRSPKTAPGGNARQLPGPNAPKRDAGRSPGPIAPCLEAQAHAALIRELRHRRRGRASTGDSPGCRGELPSVTPRSYLILGKSSTAKRHRESPGVTVQSHSSRKPSRRSACHTPIECSRVDR